MADLPLMADSREIIAQMWPEHVKHLSPPGNKMGGGSIDPDEGVVCNCGEVLGFPKVQDEADYVAAEPEQPDTSGAQTGEPDDEPDEQRRVGTDSTGVEWPAPVDTTDEEMRAQGIEPEQPLPCERNPEPHLASEHRGEEATPGEAGWNDLMADDPPWDVPDSELSVPIPTPNPGDEGEPKGVMPYRDRDVVPAEDPLTARVVVIDPRQPYTPQMVEAQLLDIEARLERGMHAQRYWEERLFAARSAYTLKAAKARLNSPGGAKDVRDAHVVVACEEEWRELELCEAMVRAMRETMHNLRSLQSGYQTVSRSVSESMRLPARSRT
jgi:hypothetical protein